MSFAGVPDELMPVVVPTAAYWVISGIYELVMSAMDMERHRLFTTEEEETKNLVNRWQVLAGVLVYQATQMSFAALLFMTSEGQGSAGAAAPPSSLLQLACQLVVAFLVSDTMQYFWHRLSHTNKFIYKHLHSMHHRLIVPYSYGSQYSHPLDAFFGDIVGGVVATLVSGMSPRTSAVFFTLLTIKGVDDHCGLWFPNHPIHRFFSNNSAFHALHHQHEGFKYNFSGYYFAFWDKLMGTYLPYSVEHRNGGGYQLRAVKELKD